MLPPGASLPSGQVDAGGVLGAQGGEDLAAGVDFQGAEGADVFAGGAAGVAVGGEGVGQAFGGARGVAGQVGLQTGGVAAQGIGVVVAGLVGGQRGQGSQVCVGVQ